MATHSKVDPIECPENCGLQELHKHCASDGCVLIGYADGDGIVYADPLYVEAVPCQNPECKGLMHPACANDDRCHRCNPPPVPAPFDNRPPDDDEIVGGRLAYQLVDTQDNRRLLSRARGDSATLAMYRTAGLTVAWELMNFLRDVDAMLVEAHNAKLPGIAA